MKKNQDVKVRQKSTGRWSKAITLWPYTANLPEGENAVIIGWACQIKRSGEIGNFDFDNIKHQDERLS